MGQSTNNLILYTARTGSTILAEILSASSGGINLNEGIVDGCDKLDVFRPSLQQYIIPEIVDHGQYNFKRYHAEKQKRIDFLKSINNWTIKETCLAFFTNMEFVEYCCNNDNVNVYMIYRKDIVAQYRSFVNMSKRKSIYTVNDRDALPGIVSDQTILGKTPVFASTLMYWRLLYEMFKSKVTLVCYEEVIRPMDFSSLGIDKSVVDNYNLRDNHIIPTPFEYVDRTDDKWLSAVNAVSGLRWITNTL
ncbi:hypothetical protein OAU13_00360 [bacterium]|nr:hypothetical protein [bacterium]